MKVVFKTLFTPRCCGTLRVYIHLGWRLGCRQFWSFRVSYFWTLNSLFSYASICAYFLSLNIEVMEELLYVMHRHIPVSSWGTFCLVAEWSLSCLSRKSHVHICRKSWSKADRNVSFLSGSTHQPDIALSATVIRVLTGSLPWLQGDKTDLGF